MTKIKFDTGTGDVNAVDLTLLGGRTPRTIEDLEARMRTHVFGFLELWQLARRRAACRRMA